MVARSASEGMRSALAGASGYHRPLHELGECSNSHPDFICQPQALRAMLTERFTFATAPLEPTMTQRLLVAVIAILFSLAPASARAQDRTKGPSNPKAKPPATLEQRIADLEAQAAKLMKEAQAL